MGTPVVTAAALLRQGDRARAAGQAAQAAAAYGRATDLAAADGDIGLQTRAALRLAGCQLYNVTPGALPVRLHAAYARVAAGEGRARLAAALARCWSYANEPARARPFADEALALAEASQVPELVADAMDAALTAYWGPDEPDRRQAWARRLDDLTVHLVDPDARLQAHLWALTLAWEAVEIPRVQRELRALDLLAEESARAEFFAASRRLPLDLLQGHPERLPPLLARARSASQAALIPDGFAVEHNMIAFTAVTSGDAETCADEAAFYEDYAAAQGVLVVRAEAVLLRIAAGQPDAVRGLIGAFTPSVLARLPRDADYLLVLQCILEGALAVSDRDLAADVASRLEPYVGRAVINAGGVAFHGMTDDTLARAAALRGDHAEARRRADAALAAYERIGAVWWHARLRDLFGRHTEPVDRPAEPFTVHLYDMPGGLWAVGRDGAIATLPALRGLGYLQRLVHQAGVPLSAVALTGGSEEVVDAGLDVLDEQARAAYRRRLTELDNELAELSAWGDLGRIERLQDEREALLHELRAATGLGGRRRTTGSTSERARVAVRKAIAAAISRIAQTDPWLGRHLDAQVHTGAMCHYAPDPDHPVTWRLRQS